ncbi:hypothetical protein [Candidatus Odyssella acanthamoebae]|uniref:Uncharacterized protein n=1 Tax=Candidatus Odyssella acanthamoebae TaxID=91604 RepID=A0A077ARA1_9PROT|nr:hypothetical protein [Candidatus Paracaedibacter acanthamoebae]AIK95712.1 hypothetical protein ID47_01600 [Candidatus Paracaedibacter acanthamoebae]
MNFVNKKALLERLKTHVSTWQQQQLLFSYDIKGEGRLSDATLRLHQRQTGFSLTVSMHFLEEALQVTNFTLQEDDRLEDQCQPLYDAALIELMIQSLMLLFFCAQSLHKNEMCFILSNEGTFHFDLLKSLFSSVQPCLTRQGKCQILTLSLWPSEADQFCYSLEHIKIQLQHQLWRYQKSDSLVRRYLQNADRQAVDVFNTHGKNNPRETESSEKNVISFSSALKRRAAL